MLLYRSHCHIFNVCGYRYRNIFLITIQMHGITNRCQLYYRCLVIFFLINIVTAFFVFTEKIHNILRGSILLFRTQFINRPLPVHIGNETLPPSSLAHSKFIFSIAVYKNTEVIHNTVTIGFHNINDIQNRLIDHIIFFCPCFCIK